MSTDESKPLAAPEGPRITAAPEDILDLAAREQSETALFAAMALALKALREETGNREDE